MCDYDSCEELAGVAGAIVIRYRTTGYKKILIKIPSEISSARRLHLAEGN